MLQDICFYKKEKNEKKEEKKGLHGLGPAHNEARPA